MWFGLKRQVMFDPMISGRELPGPLHCNSALGPRSALRSGPMTRRNEEASENAQEQTLGCYESFEPRRSNAAEAT